MSGQGTYIKHGDAEAVCIHILTSATEISSYPGGAPTVRGDFIGYAMGNRWIQVIRQGGSKRWPSIDRPRIDFHVLAERRSVAQDIAQVAEAVIFREVGQRFPAYGLSFTGVVEETAPFRAPDKETGSYRYIFALRLTCTPTF